MTEGSKPRFPQAVYDVLVEAGWAPGRRVPDDQLQAWSEQLEGFPLFESAERVLREFGGLSVDQEGPGLTSAREPFEIDPLLALHEEDRFELYRDEYGVQLYPLGEAGSGHGFLAIDPAGRTYFAMGDLRLVAETFDGALEALVLGKAPTPLD
jgi:SUKH-3 immunity protein